MGNAIITSDFVSALLYFDTLTQATRTNYGNAIQTLRDHYTNANQREIHAINFDARNYDEGKETPRDYVDAFRVLARKAFPANEQDARIRDKFIKGMPSKWKKKLLGQAANQTVDDLVDFINRRLAIDKACPPDDNLNAFSELNMALQKQMTEALHELNKTKDDIKSAQENLVFQVTNAQTTQYKYQDTQPPERRQQSFRPRYFAPRGQDRGRSRGSYRPSFTNRQSTQYQRPYTFSPRYAPPQRDYSNYTCHTCGLTGHISRQCSNQQSTPTRSRNRMLPYEQRPKN